jgi:hypothetical protein
MSAVTHAKISTHEINSKTKAAANTRSFSRLAADQSRNEHGLVRGWIKVPDQLRTTLSSPHGRSEPGSGQFFETPLGFGHGGGIRRIEFMAGIAGSIHHDLQGHGVLLGAKCDLKHIAPEMLGTATRFRRRPRLI